MAAPTVCDAGKYTYCPENDVKAEGSSLDHVDLLGYSGMAFRIQALPRMMVCRSTISPKYGYKPGKIMEPVDVDSALRLALQLNDTQTFGEYVSGQAAYVLWISLLEADDDSAYMIAQLEPHKPDGGLDMLNKDCLRGLIHARSAAAPFLRRRAEELSGEQQKAVLEAADRYEEVVVVLESAGATTWDSKESRALQADAMRKAMALEAEAAKLLSKATKTG